MILNFSNPSDIQLFYFQSVYSWAKVDGFKKFKIICLDLMMEKDEKQYQFSLVFYDFEKLAGVAHFIR